MKIRLIVCSIAFLFVILQSHPVFAKERQLEVLSESAILIDKKSGQVLSGKNENEKMNPASITKIATAIYAIENGSLNDQVTISENATNVEGTTVYLEAGETVPLQQLIIGMFVNSGNDAAIAIAEHIDGDVHRFAKNINNYFKEEIGVTNTHFENPHGLYGNHHYTTAADMAEITRYAMNNNDFRKIFNMKEYEWNSKSWDTTIVSHHRLLLGEFPNEAEITGGKNGFINESGFTLVTAAKKDDLELIVVTMKTDFKNMPYKDTIQLLNYGFENFQSTFIPSGTSYSVGDAEYLVKNDLFYAKSLSEPYSKEVDSNGRLMISDSSGNAVAEFQLELKNKAIPEFESKNSKEGNDDFAIILKSSFSNIALLAIIAAILGMLIYKRRKKKWKQGMP